MREIESKLHSVVVGNSALYTCRTKEYYNLKSALYYDGSMHKYYVLQGKRAIYNKDTIAYEKAESTR